MEIVQVYKVDGKLYEKKEDADIAERNYRLKLIVDEFSYTGIDGRGILDGIIDNWESIKAIVEGG